MATRPESRSLLGSKSGSRWRPAGTNLGTILAAIKRSPIVSRIAARLLLARDWSRVRKSPDVDAYVLAWIASHVHGPRRVPRNFM